MTKIFLVFALVLFTAQLSQAQWEPDVRLTNNPDSSMTSYNMSWCVASFDDFVHVVWYDNRVGNWDIYYKRSTDGGITWEPDVRLTNNNSSSKKPSIVVSGNEVHVVWYDDRDGNNEIYYKRSTDGGVIWEADTRISNAPGPSMYPSLSVSGSSVHVVWDDDRSGTPNYEIYYRQSTDGGSTWGEETLLANELYSYFASIATSGSTVHVVWSDSRSGHEELYYKRSNDEGVTWGEDKKLTDVTSISKFPSIAISGTDVHVVWTDWRNGLIAIYYKRSQDGGIGWDDDIRLIFDEYGNPRFPNIVVSGQVIHVVWEDNREGNFHIYYKRSDDVGENWGEDTLISENGFVNSWNPSVAVSGSALHVVWNDDRDGNYEIYYKRDPTGGIPVGIENELPLNSSQEVSVYPNPASTILNISFNSLSDETLTLRFIDMSGKTLLVTNFKAVEGLNQYTINLDDFSNGLYFIDLIDGTNRIFRKVIVKK